MERRKSNMRGDRRDRRDIRSTTRNGGQSTRQTVYSRHAKEAGKRDTGDLTPIAGSFLAGGSSLDNPYSRSASSESYTKTRKKKKRNRIIIVALVLAAVLVLSGVGVAFGYVFPYMNRIESNLRQGVDQGVWDTLDSTYAGEPFYALLLGTDKSKEREDAGDFGDTFRSDSMILARIDPENKQVTLISLHRDTAIKMGEYGTQKLNAAFAFGGAPYAIKVVSEFADVPISHYAEIDFDGFREVVDALGGVEVDVPMEIDDVDAGGHVDAGVQTLNGDQALILCRARNVYNEFGDGDRYRAANQRLVLSAIANKMLQSDPVTIANTVEKLSQYVTTTMGVSDIVSLAQNLRGMDVDTSVYSAMEPTEAQFVNGGWYEYVVEDEWDTMMSRVRAGLPPTKEDVVDEGSGTILAYTGSGQAGTSDSGGANQGSGNKSGTSTSANQNTNPSTSVKPTGDRSGSVTVKNGMGVSGVGDEVASLVETLGYNASASNARNFDYQMSVVVYNSPDQKDAAEEIAKLLDIDVTTENTNGNYEFEGDFLVLLGADYVE